jgi:uncharacterized protein YfaS (alpha-2-macroglobulin family)
LPRKPKEETVTHRPSANPRRIAVILLTSGLLLTAAAACQRKDGTPSPLEEAMDTVKENLGGGQSAAPGGAGGKPLAQPATPGVYFSLAGADGAAATAEPAQSVAGEPLEQAALQRRLATLPDLGAEGPLQTSFRFREGPKPPAIPGDTRTQPFPAPADKAGPPPEALPGELTVLRYGPEGEQESVPRLSVTFSRPMVPLTSIAQLAAKDLPVTLAPQPAGQWRWLGTRTLVFEPEGGRLPKATRYTVTVPAGIKDAAGQTLAKAVGWELALPALAIVDAWPSVDETAADLEPLIIVRFNQRVSAESLLDGKLTLEAGGKAVALREATPEELASDPGRKALVDGAPAGSWLALKPARALPKDSAVKLLLAAGAPSAEGPLTSADDYEHAFRTYGPLKALTVSCPGADDNVAVEGGDTLIEGCDPMSQGFSIQFNNILDRASIGDEDLEIDPPLTGQGLSIYENVLQIEGMPSGRTTYTVRVPAGLTDRFGQRLGQELTVRFKTGSMRPALLVPGDQNVVLDPAAKGVMELYTVNNARLRVVLKRVTPEDWPAFQSALNSPGRDPDLIRGGTVVSDEVIETKAPEDTMTPLRLDLNKALTGGKGMVAVAVLPLSQDEEDWLNRPQWRWVQVTDLGLDASLEAGKARLWVTDLAGGAPVAGAALRLDGATATTDAQGLATLDLSTRGKDLPVVVTKGEDSALLNVWAPEWDSQAQGLWFVFDDRGIYRPGEDVHFKGWLRQQGAGSEGDLGRVDPSVTELSFKLTDAAGNTIAEGRWPLGPAGGFDGVIRIPGDVAVGPAGLELRALGTGAKGLREHYGTVNIAEFRRPEFEVQVAAEKAEWLQGQTASVEATAAYYGGGPLGGAAVDWSVSGSPSSYSPPGHDDFQFGRWTPWWMDARPVFDDFGRMRSGFGGGAETKNLAARTDATGRHRLAIALEGVSPLSAASFSVSAGVQDINRQNISGSSSFLVHPAEVYVGLRGSGWFVKPDEAYTVDAIVAAIDGELALGRPITIVAERVEREWLPGGEVEETVKKVGGCDLKSGAEPVTCELSFDKGGEYRISAETSDAAGRPNQSQIQVWVSGGGWMGGYDSADRRLQADTVTLVPDKDSYQPGDTARLLIQSPFAPAEALISVRRSGTLQSERRSIDASGSLTFELPITEGFMPNVHVQVDIVGAKAREDDDGKPSTTLPKQPALATGSIRLPVPPKRRELTVTAKPAAAQVAPGADIEVALTVLDASGKPVADAELALVVVDEAVLALTRYQMGDPLAAFYPDREPGVTDNRLRELLQLADPRLVADMDRMSAANLEAAPMAMADGAIAEEGMALMAKAMTGGRGGGGGGGDAYAVDERTDFNPLAAFVPDARSAADGTVTVKVKLPDNVTRYRVMAVATDGGQRFGKGEAALLAQLPLTVRPSAPRFLNYGDRFELPVVVQNLGKAPVDVDVLVRAANLGLDGGWTDEAKGLVGVGRRVTVPAEGRVEVRFPATAEQAGTALFQAAAFGPDSGDAARVSLPVYTPVTTEAFATYGEIDAGAVRQPVERPAGVIPQFGALQLTTSSTALGNLTDAFLYLQSYPFECAEQVASRLMATVALKDVLRAFNAPGLPGEAEVDAAIRADLARLAAMQSQQDRGWDWWSAGRIGDPTVTLHVAHALARAQAKGYDPAASGVDMGAVDEYLLRIRDLARQAYPKLSEESIDLLQAEALYVRRLRGGSASAQVEELAGRLDKLPLDAQAWLLSAMAGLDGFDEARAAIREAIAEAATEEAATAQFSTEISETDRGVFLRSERRTDAIVLDALLGDQPDNDLIVKTVRGLLDHRVRGRWGSTQENAWVLIALDRYFRQAEGVTPDFVARAWLGDKLAAETPFVGRSADRGQSDIPLSELPEGRAVDLTVAKEGAGRLYYRLGLSYAPASLKVDPLERGFSVSRLYEAVDDPGDVRRTADGGWEVKAGSRVRVRLSMAAASRRYQVALVDPLPAGLEALNPELATTEVLPPDGDEQDDGPMPWWRWWRWYDREGFRDDRVEVFTSFLDAGDYSYSYVARATTPGRFTVPPVKVEEMYHPETFGRGGSDVVVVR